MRFLFFHADKEHDFNNNHETYPKLFFIHSFRKYAVVGLIYSLFPSSA